MIRLRPFKQCDMKYIVEWTKEERLFARWCADKFTYPLTQEQLMAYREIYDRDEHGWIFTALDECGTPVGHFLMRKADYENQSVHLGFVIINPELHGRGYGKEMISQAVKYAYDILRVDKVTLCVFANNPAAYHCYKSSGFTEQKFCENVFTFKEEKWDLYEMMTEKK